MSAKLIRMVSSGEYSDYGIHGLCLVDCEDGVTWLRERHEEYVAEHPDEKGSHSLSEQQFYNWLLQHGATAVEFQEWYLGAYGTFEPAVR